MTYNADILTPGNCLAGIPQAIIEQVEAVKWAGFETAYGNAANTIPFYLKNLFCTDTKIAMGATHQLWCSLCHQHAYVSSAALPAYDILKVGLLQLSDVVKVELLDIFLGFADCTNSESTGWEAQLWRKLQADSLLFKELSTHTNGLIADFAGKIVERLT
jgi:hypothetical protein